MLKAQRSRHIFATCAYHSGHNITNFCKSRQCLLPVCTLCIHKHNQQHREQGSLPEFKELDKVLAEIELFYCCLGAQIQKMKQQLLNMQQNKKSNQAQMRSKLLEHRSRLLRQFEQSLLNLENNLISQIVQDDLWFIKEIERVDARLTLVADNIDSSRAQLASDKLLKEVIVFHSKQTPSALQAELQALKTTTHQIIRQNITVTVDDAQLDVINQAILRFIQINIANGTSQ